MITELVLFDSSTSLLKYILSATFIIFGRFVSTSIRAEPVHHWITTLILCCHPLTSPKSSFHRMLLIHHSCKTCFVVLMRSWFFTRIWAKSVWNHSLLWIVWVAEHSHSITSYMLVMNYLSEQVLVVMVESQFASIWAACTHNSFGFFAFFVAVSHDCSLKAGGIMLSRLLSKALITIIWCEAFKVFFLKERVNWFEVGHLRWWLSVVVESTDYKESSNGNGEVSTLVVRVRSV